MKIYCTRRKSNPWMKIVLGEPLKRIDGKYSAFKVSNFCLQQFRSNSEHCKSAPQNKNLETFLPSGETIVSQK